MSIISYVAVIAAIITLLIPVTAPSLKRNNKKIFWNLNYWGYIYIFTIIIVFICGICEVRKNQNESLKFNEDLKSIIIKIQEESLRLSPQDFQIRLISYAKSDNIKEKLYSFKPTYVEGSLKNAYIRFELEEVSSKFEESIGWQHRPLYDPRIHGLGGLNELKLYFYAKNITFGGFENYPYLDNLNSDTLKFKIDLEIIKFGKSKWFHAVDLFVKGRHFSGTVDERGNVIIPISL